MPWHTLHLGTYLSEGLDSLGLERQFESGVQDSAENVERLSDYPDYDAAVLNPTGKPHYGGRGSPLPAHACPGSRQPVNGDLLATEATAICSKCGQEVTIYPRKEGMFKQGHKAAPTVSEGDAKAAPSKTN